MPLASEYAVIRIRKVYLNATKRLDRREAVKYLQFADGDELTPAEMEARLVRLRRTPALRVVEFARRPVLLSQSGSGPQLPCEDVVITAEPRVVVKR